jgi:hypothetical protein
MREKNPSYYFNIDYYLINVYIRNTNHPALHTIYQSYCIMHTTLYYIAHYLLPFLPVFPISLCWPLADLKN